METQMLSNLYCLLIGILYIVQITVFDAIYFIVFQIISFFITNDKEVLKKAFKGSTVLITGASSGIGKAFSKILHDLGANIIISARSTKNLEILRDELCLNNSNNTKVLVLSIDLEKNQCFEEYFQNLKSLMKEAGLESIDVLINNAGVSSRGSAQDTHLTTLKKIMVLLILTIF
jgi:short-subunit dehydrogenase